MEYLIMDEGHSTLTRGVLRSPPTATILEFEIPENDVHLIEGHVHLQFVGFDENSPSFAGKVTRRRGARMAVEKGENLGQSPLENLRVPFDHETYVYPVSGDWQGRLTVQTTDLSCGALAFECNRSLGENELVQIAVHIREGALLIPAKILRQTHTPQGKIHCIAKFMSGVDDVERMVRKEVLFLQLKERDHAKDGKVSKELFRIG